MYGHCLGGPANPLPLKGGLNCSQPLVEVKGKVGDYVLFKSQGNIGTGPQHYGGQTHTEVTACD